MSKRRRNFQTRQCRMSANKFLNLSRYAYFLAKHIRRFMSFGLIEKANMFSEHLFQMLCNNPRLRKRHPVLGKIVGEVEAEIVPQTPIEVEAKINGTVSTIKIGNY